jgi:TonB family protein
LRRGLSIVCVAAAFAAVCARAVVARADEDNGDEQQHQITKAPKLKTFVEAVYPPDKKAAGVTAQVLLSVEIAEDGKVGEVAVVTPAGPDFDAAALAAVKQFVFEPAEVDGVPAPVKIMYRYHFVIRAEVVKLGPQVNFEGVVQERFSKKRMPGVKVTVKDLGLSVETDAEGSFKFIDLPLGTHKVELSSPKLITVATDEEIQKDKKKTVKYLVEEKEVGVDEEVVVRAPRIKKESVETVIRTEEARRVPGTQGDTLKVVQNLPGVGRSSFGSGQLVVWGSAPGDTQVFVDGVPISALYHVGGLRSTVNSDLVRSIELQPGGYGADYGGGLGGLVRVETRSLPNEGVHGYVAADVIDASAMITAAITPRLSVAIAGRYSYLDRLLPLVTSADFGDFVPIPRYDDYQAMATLKLRKDEELTALFLASDDHLRRSIASQDPSAVRSEVTDSSWKRGLLRYSRIMPDGSSLNVTPFFGYDSSSSTTTFGPVPTELDTTAWVYGLRAGYRRKIAKPATLSIGFDLTSTRTTVSRSGSVDLPPREGDITVFGQPPGDDVATDHWTTTIASAAPYASMELKFGPMVFTPGLRLAAFAIDGDRSAPPSAGVPTVGFSRLEWGFDPRLTVAYRPKGRFSAVASAGLYHQAPDPRDLSAVFGNPNLGLSQAVHYSAGGALKLTGTLSLEVIGFYKSFDHLVARSELPTPPLASALTQDGVGRSYGGQLLLRQDLWKGFFGWVTYSLIRSERKDHPDQDWRLFDYDQTHVLAVLLSYALPKGFTAGVRFRYSTGFPRTPVVGSFYDSRDDEFQPIFGAHNSIRIPSFYQLDARIEKSFNFKAWSLNIFLDVQNVTNRQNPEEIIYPYNYNPAGRQYIFGLPTLAVAGIRLERL